MSLRSNGVWRTNLVRPVHLIRSKTQRFVCVAIGAQKWHYGTIHYDSVWCVFVFFSLFRGSHCLFLVCCPTSQIFITIRADGLISSATPSRKPSLSPHSSQAQVQDKTDGDDEVIAADDAEDENECCICLESLQLPIVITCKHRFCFLCLKSVTLTKGHVCPLCRSPFNPSVLTR